MNASFLKEFEKVSLPSIGFHPFESQDLEAYQTNPKVFSLDFNKVTGKGILYGLNHVSIRRSFFNTMDKPNRIKLFTQKLKAIEEHISIDPISLDKIRDVTDIGMGHSVYLVTTTHHQWVLKAHDTHNLSFFTDVLKAIQWPSYTAYSFKRHGISYECAEYLGSESLSNLNITDYVSQLAKHAALGDVLGRGDRHSENYIIRDGLLYPLDVAYIFWPDNEVWLERYITGGMAEYSTLYYLEGSERERNQQLFWEVYRQTHRELDEKKSTLCDVIHKFYPQDFDEKRRFVEKRLNQHAYVSGQESLYIRSFLKMCELQDEKKELQGKVLMDRSFLERDAYLNMYYWADLDRLSCFFLRDYFRLSR